ncbi:hypothetical protein GCM10007108_05770 [Thermogymnomonas acidicola]|uniref:Uncharacterized protein n=1 Tax=Thermogymnomonas acidicola TaxID=399579 RepID=A0AA37BR55_9ARCH|nr:hypothetical protein GCM10007108_05770 [Thermogymnomonas acidicola]
MEVTLCPVGCKYFQHYRPIYVKNPWRTLDMKTYKYLDWNILKYEGINNRDHSRCRSDRGRGGCF